MLKNNTIKEKSMKIYIKIDNNKINKNKKKINKIIIIICNNMYENMYIM